VTRRDRDGALSDDELSDLVGAALDECEPLPTWAVDFAVGAFAWRDVDGKLAELLHDSVLEEAVVLRDDTGIRLLVFQAGDVTLDIEHGPGTLVGALTPPGRYRVEVNDGGPDRTHHDAAPPALTDDAGMFQLDGEIRGQIRFVVRHPDGQVVLLSPWTTF